MFINSLSLLYMPQAACNTEYLECGIAADSDEPDLNANWEYSDFIKLHRTDVNGTLHTFSDAESGMYVEIFNNDGSGFGLFQHYSQWYC